MTLKELKKLLGADTAKSILLCSAEGRRLLAESRLKAGKPGAAKAREAVRGYIDELRARCAEYTV